MSQSSGTFVHESQGTTVYVSVADIYPKVERFCQVCKKPLSGRGAWKFCPDHRAEAYHVSRRMGKLRHGDRLNVEFWTRVAAEDYLPESLQRAHAVLPAPDPRTAGRSKARKCPLCPGRMKQKFGLWECPLCGHQLE